MLCIAGRWLLLGLMGIARGVSGWEFTSEGVRKIQVLMQAILFIMPHLHSAASFLDEDWTLQDLVEEVLPCQSCSQLCVVVVDPGCSSPYALSHAPSTEWIHFAQAIKCMLISLQGLHHLSSHELRIDTIAHGHGSKSTWQIRR